MQPVQHTVYPEIIPHCRCIVQHIELFPFPNTRTHWIVWQTLGKPYTPSCSFGNRFLRPDTNRFYRWEVYVYTPEQSLQPIFIINIQEQRYILYIYCMHIPGIVLLNELIFYTTYKHTYLFSKVRESEIFTVLTCKPCKLPFAAFYQLPSPLPELCYNLNIFFTSYTHANICYLLLL